MSVPYFYPKRFEAQYKAILFEAYRNAKAEAQKIASVKGINTKIEFLKPVHLNRTTYNLPGSADTEFTLKSNVAIFPFGLLNEDPTFDYMKWWEGAKTRYIGDWFTRPVYLFEEKEGVYAGNLNAYAFRGDETFTINLHSTTSSALMEAWLLAWAVMPVTLEEVKIIT